MPEIKHTPGPWAAVLDLTGRPCVLTHRDDQEPEDWDPAESGAYISTGIGDHTEQRTHGNEWANAKLIAAAPNLLALVERMRSYMGQAGIDSKPESMNPMEKLASDIDIALSELAQPLTPA